MCGQSRWSQLTWCIGDDVTCAIVITLFYSFSVVVAAVIATSQSRDLQCTLIFHAASDPSGISDGDTRIGKAAATDRQTHRDHLTALHRRDDDLWSNAAWLDVWSLTPAKYLMNRPTALIRLLLANLSIDCAFYVPAKSMYNERRAMSLWHSLRVELKAVVLPMSVPIVLSHLFYLDCRIY